MHNFRKLNVWQSAIDLTTEIYLVTKSFPSDEKFGLTSQMRRSAVSVPSNIAEGAGRNSTKEFGHFLGICMGSSCELETQLIISNKIGYLNDTHLENLISELQKIQKQIYSLKNSLNNR